MLGDWKCETWQTRHQIKQWCHCPLNCSCRLLLILQIKRWCQSTVESNMLKDKRISCLSRFDSGAYTVDCSFRVQSAYLSALIRSPYWLQSRDNNSSSNEDRQAPVPAATIAWASESVTAAAATTSDDYCEVCFVAPRTCWLRTGAMWTCGSLKRVLCVCQLESCSSAAQISLPHVGNRPTKNRVVRSRDFTAPNVDEVVFLFVELIIDIFSAFSKSWL